MRLDNSLRTRIIFYFTAFGITSGVLLLASMVMVVTRIESLFINTFLDQELEHFVDLKKVSPGINSLHENKMLGFMAIKGFEYPGYTFLEQPTDKPFLTTLNGLNYFGLGREIDDRRYVILFEVTEFNQIKRTIIATLAGITLLFVLLTVRAAFSLAGRIIAPVVQLASQIKTLPEGAPQRLSLHYSHDELGQLARAFDSYMERLNRFVTREQNFTADASHELRTPIAIIQGASEVLLARADTPPEIRKRIERIERAANDMAHSVAAMLMLAREPSHSAYHERTDLAAVVRELVEVNRSLLSGKPVDVELRLTETPGINAAPNLVRIVINNLIRNAFYYTEEGSIRIELRNDLLCVSDTGIGISEKDLQHIFERGYRAMGAPGGGSGLGLSIAKRICDHYGWQLVIESEPRVGTQACWHFG